MDDAEVQRNWPSVDDFCGMPGLGDRIEARRAGLYRIAETDAYLVMSVGLTKDSDARALWVENLIGEVGYRPRQNLRLMAEVLSDCTAYAVASYCSEIRIETGTRGDWKARLLPSFGFETLDLGSGRMVWRKELTHG